VFRIVLLLLWLLSLSVDRVAAQRVSRRSQDYLFLTKVADIRALLVNPVGLAIVPKASILSELTFERLGGNLRVEQYAIGFNSRGVSISYQRNRLVGEKPVGTLRTGFGFPLEWGSHAIARTQPRATGRISV